MADPKILIAGVAALAYLLSGSKKASASTTSNTKPKEEKTPEQDGDIGELPGPNGCKPGYVLGKDGKCQLPDVEKDENNQGGGGGTYAGKPSDLIISTKCDKFTFGDGTGEAWWKEKGYKAAKAWVDAKWDDALYIAVSMLRKNKEVCFKDFPQFIVDPNLPKEQIPPEGEQEFQMINWIRKYPKIWQLVWFVRNKIDMTFFEGKTSVTIDPKTWKYTYGKKFDLDLMWENGLDVLAEVLLAVEQEDKGVLLNKANNASYSPYTSTANFLYWMIFPNLELKTILSKYEKGLMEKDEFWDKLSELIDELDGFLPGFDPPEIQEV